MFGKIPVLFLIEFILFMMNLKKSSLLRGVGIVGSTELEGLLAYVIRYIGEITFHLEQNAFIYVHR